MEHSQEMLERLAFAVLDNSTAVCNSTAAVADSEQQKALEMTASLVLLLFALLGGNILHALHLHWVPESCVFMLTGFAFASVIRIFYTAQQLFDFMSLTGPTFMLILLPPIIFDGGFSVKKVYFFRNLVLILQLAIIGTFISAIFVGLVLYLLSTFTSLLPEGMSAAECLAFGSLISATDPVAALSVYSSLGVEKTLFSLVYGESNLNDAIGIVLFSFFKEIVDQGANDDTSVSSMLMHGLLQFLLACIAAPIVGMLIGVISCLFFRLTKFNETPIMEAIAFWCFAYVSYLFADAFYLSGIISTLFCGFTMRHYTYYNLSDRGKAIASDLIKTIATTFDCAIFLNLGIAILALPTLWNWWLVSIALVLCLVGRAFVVAILVNLGNIFRRKRQKIQPSIKPINFREQYILWHAGLRGAVAYVLCLQLDTQFQDYWLATTLFIILFTVLLLGITTAPMLKLLRIQTDSESRKPLSQINFNNFGEVYLSFENKLIIPVLIKKSCQKDLAQLQDMMSGHEPEEVEREIDRQASENENPHYRIRTTNRDYDSFGFAKEDLENPFHEETSLN